MSVQHEPVLLDIGLKERTSVYIRVESDPDVPLPPIALNLSSERSPFNFLEHLTPQQAVDLSKALASAAMHAEYPEEFPG